MTSFLNLEPSTETPAPVAPAPAPPASDVEKASGND